VSKDYFFAPRTASFVSRPKALRLVSSLRMGAMALREERESLRIDSPLAIADLCSEMRFLDASFFGLFF